MKTGISIAGNILVDKIKIIDYYPEKSMLSNIKKESMAVGGCVANTIIDLAKIDKSIYLKAYAKIGNDGNGKYLLEKLKENNIDTSNVKTVSSLNTSYTDVMTIEGTGERTFFHSRGANKEFSIEDIDIEKIDTKIFHIGYLLLLDSLDKEDSEYGTAMARLLKAIEDKGIKTSIDVVSESSSRYQKVIKPSLKYCNYVIINEIEASRVTGIDIFNQDKEIDDKKIELVIKNLYELGVKDKVVVHSPKCGYTLSKDKKLIKVPSLNLPKDYIKGTVGAGDAFCACCLYSLYNGYDDETMLKFASLGAACNLSREDSISGMRSKDEILSLESKFDRR